MAIIEHVELVRQGKHKAVERLIQEGNTLDLSGENITNFDLNLVFQKNAVLTNTILSNMDLGNRLIANVNLEGATLHNVNLIGTEFRNVNLKGADFSNSKSNKLLFDNCNLDDANFNRVQFSNTTIQCGSITSVNFKDANFQGATVGFDGEERVQIRKCNLSGSQWPNSKINLVDFIDIEGAKVNLSQSIIHGSSFLNVQFDSASFNSSKFYQCKFKNSDIRNIQAHNSNFKESEFEIIDCSLGDFSSSRFLGCQLKKVAFNEAKLSIASFIKCTFEDLDFEEAEIDRTEFRVIAGLDKCKNLETVIVTGNSKHLDSAKIPKLLKRSSWEFLRIMGGLPLFGASYFVLISFPIFFDLIDEYNHYMAAGINWADENNFADMTNKVDLFQYIGEKVRYVSPGVLIYSTYVGAIFLAVGSTIYSIFCPTRIKEFSKDQWVDEHKNELLLYWSLSWSRPALRTACLSAYTIGGLLIGSVLIWKTVNSLGNILIQFIFFLKSLYT